MFSIEFEMPTYTNVSMDEFYKEHLIPIVSSDTTSRLN